MRRGEEARRGVRASVWVLGRPRSGRGAPSATARVRLWRALVGSGAPGCAAPCAKRRGGCLGSVKCDKTAQGAAGGVWSASFALTRPLTRGRDRPHRGANGPWGGKWGRLGVLCGEHKLFPLCDRCAGGFLGKAASYNAAYASGSGGDKARRRRASTWGRPFRAPRNRPRGWGWVFARRGTLVPPRRAGGVQAPQSCRRHGAGPGWVFGKGIHSRVAAGGAGLLRARSARRAS